MRILALSHLFPHTDEPRYGIFVARQLQGMAEAGADITVLVPRPRVPKVLRTVARANTADNIAPLVEYDGVTSISIPFMSLPGKWFWRWAGLFAYRAIRETARQLHAAKPFDVIYSTQMILGGDAGNRLAKQLQVPAANLAIGTDVNVIAKQSASLKKHYRHILGELSGTLSCGQSLKDEIQIHRPSPPHLETLCVYGVVDVDRFAPLAGDKTQLRSSLKLPNAGPLLLYVGYLRREKGLMELITAFEKVITQVPNANLVICGSGVDENEIKRNAEASTASSAIHFPGLIAPSAVRDYMQAADLFVLPSYNEGMPNAVMEAMACGLPVVCTTVGGLPAAIGDSRGARLVAPEQVAPLERALAEILADESLRSEMSSAARQTAIEQFDLRNSATRILEYLSRVASTA